MAPEWQESPMRLCFRDAVAVIGAFVLFVGALVIWSFYTVEGPRWPTNDPQ